MQSAHEILITVKLRVEIEPVVMGQDTARTDVPQPAEEPVRPKAPGAAAPGKTGWYAANYMRRKRRLKPLAMEEYLKRRAAGTSATTDR